MTDTRTLLERAARAAGITIATWSNCQAGGFLAKDCMPTRRDRFWDPLIDDGDALRLAVQLEIDVHQRLTIPPEVWAQAPMQRTVIEPANGDRLSATRLAIVRAASSINGGRE